MGWGTNNNDVIETNLVRELMIVLRLSHSSSAVQLQQQAMSRPRQQ